MREEGESVCVSVCLYVCLFRSLRSLLFKQKRTAAKHQIEVMVTVLYCSVVTGLLRSCRVCSYLYVGPLLWEMQRTQCLKPLQSINCKGIVNIFLNFHTVMFVQKAKDSK